MKSLRRNFVLLFLLSLLMGANAAFAQPAPAQNDQQGPPRGGGFMGMNNAVHGTVTAISGGEFTIKTEQGETYKIATGPNTRIMKDRQPIKASDVHTGDVVMTGGDVDDKAHTVGAVFLAVLDAEQVQRMKQAQADFGKTWTAGKITAINDLSLTIERPDKVTQTVTVDENTSFHKHRDSITLADIKVGDTITARGAVQNNAFLATQLSVIDPNQRGPRNGNPPGAANGAQPQKQ
jgi:Domain of unknown function (DUF5666)